MSVNGEVYQNVTLPALYGLFTYIVHPSNCSATDYQNFNFYTGTTESPRFISYLETLTDGRSPAF